MDENVERMPNSIISNISLAGCEGAGQERQKRKDRVIAVSRYAPGGTLVRR